MGETISKFLEPRIPSISQEKQESILKSKDFHWNAFGHALLITFAGIVFIGLLLLQVLVLGISSTDLLSADWRVVAVSFIISTITYRSLQLLRNLESTATAASRFKHEDVYADRSTLLNNVVPEAGAFIFFSAVVLAIDYILSSANPASLLVLITHGHVLEFFLVLFIYILLAGSVGGAISSLALMYYDSYVFLLAAHIWVRKLVLVLSVKLSMRPVTLAEVLERRCPQCSANRAEFGAREDNRRIFFCDLCGYRFPESNQSRETQS